MSHLPSAIDSVLTVNDVEKAKKAIIEASASIPRVEGFPTLPLPLRPSSELKEGLPMLQKVYENMEWATAFVNLTEVLKMPFKFSQRYNSRLLFCDVLVAETEPAILYRNLVAQLKLDGANGDLYIGMALLKLNEHNLIDCAFLLDLAELCPIYHPNCLKLGRDKMEWITSAYRTHVFSISDILRNPKTLQWYKENCPEIEAAPIEVDEAIKEWNSSSSLERFRLCHVWIKTPHLAPFLTTTIPRVVPGIGADAPLLCLPESAFDKILEHLDTRTILNIGQTSLYARRYSGLSPVWQQRCSVLLNIPIEKLAQTPSNYFMYALHLSAILKSLETAHMWDISSFGMLMAVSASNSEGVQWLTPLQNALVVTVTSLANFLLPVEVVQWLVSTSNFHITLARLSNTLPTSILPGIYNALLSFLRLFTPEVSLSMARDLKNIGFEHSLLIRATDLPEAPSLAALHLLSYIKLCHLLHSSVNRLNDSTDEVFAAIDLNEAKEKASTLLPGVYHLAGFNVLDLPESDSCPFFASFQVEARDVKVLKPSGQPEFDGVLEAPESLEVSSHAEMALLLKGRGKMIDEFGEESFVELHAALSASDFTEYAFSAHVGGAQLSLSGLMREGSASGVLRRWQDVETDSIPRGFFLLWRSSLPDTESNWEKHLQDLDALRKLRSTGLQAQLRRNTSSRSPPSVAFSEIRSDLLDYLPYHRLAANERLYHTVMGNAKAILNGEVRSRQWERDASLPRDPYELDELYEARILLLNHSTFLLWDVRAALATEYMASNRAAVLSDIKTALIGFIRLCEVVSMELKANNGFQNPKPDSLLAAFVSLYYHPEMKAHDIKNVTKAATAFLKSLDAPIPRLRDLDLLSNYLKFFSFKSRLHEHQHPFEANQALSTILSFMFGLAKKASDIGPSEAQTQLASPDYQHSPICQSFISEIIHEESQSPYEALYHRWSNRLHFSLWDPCSPLLTPNELITIFLSILKMEQVKLEEENEASQEESEDEDDDEDASFSASKLLPSAPSLTPTTAIAIGVAFAAALALGTFAVGRLLRNRD